MNKEIEIPKGYEARIEGNKVIIEQMESKDEKIRKKILAEYKDRLAIASIEYKNPLCNKELVDFLKKAIAYLEKQKEQKEQKPNIELIQRSWYMEGYHDREFGQEPKWVIKTGKYGPKYEENEKYGQPLEQKPAEWSEEDERKIEFLTGLVEDWAVVTSLSIVRDETINWLKSLRPQPHWKPNKEQMAALNEAINEAADSGSIHLNSWRYNLLKEIKEKIK